MLDDDNHNVIECTDRYCKTNYPESKVLCRKCLNNYLRGMSQEDLLDIYYAIQKLLYTTPSEKSIMNRIFGPRPIDVLDEVASQWFGYINGLLLSDGGRRGG